MDAGEIVIEALEQSFGVGRVPPVGSLTSHEHEQPGAALLALNDELFRFTKSVFQRLRHVEISFLSGDTFLLSQLRKAVYGQATSAGLQLFFGWCIVLASLAPCCERWRLRDTTALPLMTPGATHASLLFPHRDQGWHGPA